MTEQKRINYTPQFKMDAVRLVTEQGYKVAEAARNLGIHPSALNRWKRQLTDNGPQAFPGKGHLIPEKEEPEKQGEPEENQRVKWNMKIYKKPACLQKSTIKSSSSAGDKVHNALPGYRNEGERATFLKKAAINGWIRTSISRS